MIRKWLLFLSLGAAMGLSAPTSYAQNTTGSNGGVVSPETSGVSGLGAKNVAADSAAGSPGSAPETSLSRRSAAEPATREGDAPNQIATLAPYALALAVFLAAALYFFVFRKSTSAEGDAAANGTNTQ